MLGYSLKVQGDADDRDKPHSYLLFLVFLYLLDYCAMSFKFNYIL